MNEPAALTLDEAAEQLGVHYMTVYRYVRTGRLPATKVGAQWRVRAKDLTAFKTGTDQRGAPTRRHRVDHGRRLENRLLAADEAGAWDVVQAALAGGLDPGELYLDVLGSALESIGDRWERGEVTVAEEHQASGVVLRLVGRLGPRFNRRGRKRGTIVLGAPPGERHGVPTALVADLLRGEGFVVIDLGPDVPARSFADAVTEAGAVLAVGIAATTSGNDANVVKAISAVREVTGAPIVLGGAAVSDAKTATRLGADHWSASALDAVDRFNEIAAESSRLRRQTGGGPTKTRGRATSGGGRSRSLR